MENNTFVDQYSLFEPLVKAGFNQELLQQLIFRKYPWLKQFSTDPGALKTYQEFKRCHAQHMQYVLAQEFVEASDARTEERKVLYDLYNRAVVASSGTVDAVSFNHTQIICFRAFVKLIFEPEPSTVQIA